MEELRSRSAGGARYRALSSKSAVDESLFGPSKEEKANFDRARNAKKLAAVSNSKSNYVVISSSDLENIKNGSLIRSEADILEERRLKEEALVIKEKISRERKLKMKELEIIANQKRVRSDIEIEEEAKQAALRQLASEQVDSNNDVVKALNSMRAKAVTFSLRDMQKEERLKQLEKEVEYNKKMDLIMEIDRLKDLHAREEVEKAKIQKRVNDRSVIIEQIKFRERLRLLAAEAREQDNIEMRKTMARYKEEEERKEALRQAEIARNKIEFTKANEELLNKKKEIKLNEKKEVEDILIYQALKDAELAKREADELELANQKKKRQLELLAQQEKAQDNLGKLDEIRARRASEERERRARDAERKEREKKERDMNELLAARAAQALEKKKREERLKDEALLEIENGIRMRAKLKAREDEEAAKLGKLREEHRINLHKQIEDRRNQNKGDHNDNLNEGEKYRQKLLYDETRFNVIRKKMTDDLLKKGVNPLYLAEMQNCDIRKLINR